MLISFTLNQMDGTARRMQENFAGSFRSVVGLIRKTLEDRPELFQSSVLARGGTERAIVIECCQSMYKRPGGDCTQFREFLRTFILLRETKNHSETGLCRALDVGIFRSIKARVKHYIEIVRMVSREAQIGHSGIDKLVSKVVSLFNGIVYFTLKQLISIAGRSPRSARLYRQSDDKVLQPRRQRAAKPH